MRNHGEWMGSYFDGDADAIKGWVTDEEARKELEIDFDVEIKIEHLYSRYGFVAGEEGREMGFYNCEKSQGAFKSTKVTTGK